MKDDGDEHGHHHGVARRIVLITRVSAEEEELIREAVQASPHDLIEWMRHALISTAK